MAQEKAEDIKGQPLAKIEPKKVPAQQPQVVIPKPLSEQDAMAKIAEIESNAEKNPTTPPLAAHPNPMAPPPQAPPVAAPPAPQQSKITNEQQKTMFLQRAQRNPNQVMIQGAAHFGNWVVVNSPRVGPFSPDDALCLAAWLIRFAEESGNASFSFSEVWDAVTDA